MGAIRLFIFNVFCLLSALALSIQVVYAKECTGNSVYGTDSDYILNTTDGEIKIMSYNVENLFDALHDEDRDDYEFLPIDHPEKSKCDFKTGYYKQTCKTLDWTDEKFQLKLMQIGDVVTSTGEMPDILGVQEVENVNAISHLADYLGYKKFLATSGSDKRIQLALLYNENKIKLKEMKEIAIKFPEEVGIKNTRNILVANFTLTNNPQKILGVIVNHWPSQAAPSGARVVAAQHVKKAIDQYSKKYGETYHVIVLGDFNTVESDDPHPFEKVIYNPEWENNMLDLHEYYLTKASKKDPKKMKSKMPKGTYFYSKDFAWNIMDRFFISQNLVDGTGTEVVAEQYRIVAPEFMTKIVTDKKAASEPDSKTKVCEARAPMRYDHYKKDPKQAGYSDHFPIMVKIKI